MWLNCAGEDSQLLCHCRFIQLGIAAHEPVPHLLQVPVGVVPKLVSKSQEEQAKSYCCQFQFKMLK